MSVRHDTSEPEYAVRTASAQNGETPVHYRVGRLLLIVLFTGVAAEADEPVVLDDFESTDTWQVIASDGVSARATRVAGQTGHALRLDFDFERGSGFCVLRRTLSLELPQHYRFALTLRGDAPPNNLEFKLIDPTGQNVWWVNRRAFEIPRAWETLTQRARQFRFAWGPAGGAPLTRLGAIEIAVAAASGGRGHILFDQLLFERLPDPSGAAELPTVGFSSARAAGAPAAAVLPESGLLDWHSAAEDAQPWLQADFPEPRELGGIALEWDPSDFATAYGLSVSPDGQRWETVAEVSGANGGRDYLLVPVAELRAVRLTVQATSRSQGVGLRGLRFLPPEVAESPHRFFTLLAQDAPRGWYPRYFLDEQQPWTVVGVPHDTKEALLDVGGALEVDERAFRIEPFLFCDGRLMTWADAQPTPALADGYLPIPSVTWHAGDAELEITALADGAAGQSTLLARYVVRNIGTRPLRGTLFLALRPFQVLPPWQDLNITGGLSRVESLSWSDNCVSVNAGQKLVRSWTPPSDFGAVAFAQGELVEFLAHGRVPAAPAVQDSQGWASAALRYDFELAPGAHRATVLQIPFHEQSVGMAAALADEEAASLFARRLARARRLWQRELHRVELTLPPAAERIESSFRSALAHILINSDGPALQPGSRSYQRSWIRDGAMESTALLYTGHAASARAFLDWFAPHQYANGKIPCVVDRRGPDPVPEHDSTGEYIYAVWQYYNFTKDRAFLERHSERVLAGVRYLDELRETRLTPEYRDGPPGMRACYGLVPASISHEGYSAKPMHSYWDDFWTMRGLEDAVCIAAALDRTEAAERCAALRDSFRTTLYDSLSRAMAQAGINYVPGCVELGDFDATSTAIALFPCGQGDALPQPACANTFERYYEFFCARRAAEAPWENYTPYEVRLVGAFVRLGQPQRAHELLDFFFQDQSPPEWNQWAEVVWRDHAAPKFIGDLPHTWVGADYLNSVRSLFVYERERDAALVLGAGLRAEWLASPLGVVVGRWPTPWGAVSYAVEAHGDSVFFSLEGCDQVPPGGFVFRIPGTRAVSETIVNGQSGADLEGRELTLRAADATVTIKLLPERPLPPAR